MTLSTWIALIAASGAIVSAAIAAFSASRARRAEHNMVSVQMRVQSLDNERKLLAEHYREMFRQSGEVSGVTDLSSFLASVEVLRANPRCTDELASEANNFRAMLQNLVYSVRPTPGIPARSAKPDDAIYESLRTAFKNADSEIMNERERLLSAKKTGMLRLRG